MANGIMNTIKAILLLQLFFSFSITILAYGIPSDSRNHITSFSSITEDINLTSVSNKVSGSLESQTNMPIIELGALIFYSGNILLDLLLNFAFAIPEMIGLLFYGLTNIVPLDPQIIYIVQLFASVAVLVTYFISLMQLLTGLRSGRVVS